MTNLGRGIFFLYHHACWRYHSQPCCFERRGVCSMYSSKFWNTRSKSSVRGFTLVRSSLPGRCWEARGRRMALSLSLVTCGKLQNQDLQCPRLVGRALGREGIPHLLKVKYTSADPVLKRRVLLRSQLAASSWRKQPLEMKCLDFFGCFNDQLPLTIFAYNERERKLLAEVHSWEGGNESNYSFLRLAGHLLSGRLLVSACPCGGSVGQSVPSSTVKWLLSASPQKSLTRPSGAQEQVPISFARILLWNLPTPPFTLILVTGLKLDLIAKR